MNGEEVGNGLEWVVVVGESVDNWDGGVLGEISDLGVCACTDDHAGGHGGDDDGGVVERLVDLISIELLWLEMRKQCDTYTELNVVLAQEHWVSTHLLNSSLSRDTSPRRALIEHYGNGLSLKSILELCWDNALLDIGLVCLGIADEGCKLDGGEVGDGEEVARVVWVLWENGWVGNVVCKGS